MKAVEEVVCESFDDCFGRTKALKGKDATHSIKINTLKNLEKALNDWSIAIENKNKNTVSYLFDTDYEDYPVFVSFEQNSKFDGDKGNIARSIHLRTNPIATINALVEGDIVYIKNNESSGLSRSLHQSETLTTNAKLVYIEDTTTNGKSQEKKQKKPGETDREYMELAKEPEKNEDKLRELVNNAAKAAGYTEEMYHGSRKSADIPNGVLSQKRGLTDETSATISISDLYKLVKEYDKDFHAGKEVNPFLLNEDGTPKVFYHQTEKDFSVFDISREGAGTRDNETPYGIFLKSKGHDR